LFFRRKTIDLFTPECEVWRSELARLGGRREQLSQEFDETGEECRRLTNEVELAGGERLRQIPLLIRQYEQQAASRRETAARYRDALRDAGVTEEVVDAATFIALQSQLPSLLHGLEERESDRDSRCVELIVERSKVRQALKDEEAELAALRQRTGNLPEALARLRRQICEDLRLPTADLLFVAELVAVRSEEREWEASIEMVLRSFARSLLVPQRHSLMGRSWWLALSAGRVGG
jgi:uncharacterized protein YPO0396